MLRTNIFEKKAISPVKKSLWPISSSIIEQNKRQKTTYKGPQGNLTSNVEVIRPFLHDPRGCWKYKFLKKKAIFPVKRFWPTSSRLIEHDERPETTDKGPQGNLTFNVEVKRSLLHDPRGWWKHKFFEKKRQTFWWRKDFNLFFLALSTLIILRGQFKRVQKGLRQLLLKL